MPAMAGLVLGPLLRYVGRTEATIWVETDGPCEVEVLGRKAPDVLRRGTPLRPGRDRGPRARLKRGVRGRARRRAGLAAAGLELPAERPAHLPRAGADRARVRLLPALAAPRAPLHPAQGDATRRMGGDSTPCTPSRAPCSRRTRRATPTCCSSAAIRSTPTRSRRGPSSSSASATIGRATRPETRSPTSRSSRASTGRPGAIP